ncbi:hypothetical protein ACP4OV_011699 [Aristida adscensionis]
MATSRLIAPAALLLLAMALMDTTASAIQAPTPAPIPAPGAAPVPSPQSLCPTGFNSLVDLEVGSKELTTYGIITYFFPTTSDIGSILDIILRNTPKGTVEVCICVPKTGTNKGITCVGLAA